MFAGCLQIMWAHLQIIRVEKTDVCSSYGLCLQSATHSERSVEIQFYLYLIVYLLMVHFKQNLNQRQESANSTKKVTSRHQEKHASRTPARGIVTLLGEKLKTFWKMSIHWITCIQNLLLKPLTPDVVAIINAIQ